MPSVAHTLNLCKGRCGKLKRLIIVGTRYLPRIEEMAHRDAILRATSTLKYSSSAPYLSSRSKPLKMPMDRRPRPACAALESGFLGVREQLSTCQELSTCSRVGLLARELPGVQSYTLRARKQLPGCSRASVRESRVTFVPESLSPARGCRQ